MKGTEMTEMMRKKKKTIEKDSLIPVAPYIWASIASLIAWLIVECLVTAFNYNPEPIAVPATEYKIPMGDDKISEPLKGRAVPKTDYNDDLETCIDDECFEYLVKCVEAEAGNQPELGKRMVCSVILNRYENWGYTTIEEVINDPGQFSVVSDGSIYTVIPTEETYLAVDKELKSRTNDQVLYFRANKYHSFGTPLFAIGDHYFSE